MVVVVDVCACDTGGCSYGLVVVKCIGVNTVVKKIQAIEQQRNPEMHKYTHAKTQAHT